MPVGLPRVRLCSVPQVSPSRVRESPRTVLPYIAKRRRYVTVLSDTASEDVPDDRQPTWPSRTSVRSAGVHDHVHGLLLSCMPTWTCSVCIMRYANALSSAARAAPAVPAVGRTALDTGYLTTAVL